MVVMTNICIDQTGGFIWILGEDSQEPLGCLMEDDGGDLSSPVLQQSPCLGGLCALKDPLLPSMQCWDSLKPHQLMRKLREVQPSANRDALSEVDLRQQLTVKRGEELG